MALVKLRKKKKTTTASEIAAEQLRLDSCKKDQAWKKWGPYVSERQWGTVREDYGLYGESWDYISHDRARSYAFRWGEEGIGGFCDVYQTICIAPAFWNGNDPILKERLFGLTNGQGNHGEDVKELYFHLESTPTHSYCKYLYKYPHAAYPYNQLIAGNQRGREEREYEILDTGIFAGQDYFDCFIEYAKAGPEDILIQITIHNRGEKAHPIHVLPQIWFRNYWKHNPRFTRPSIKKSGKEVLTTDSVRIDKYYFYHEGGKAIFCENETNNERIYGSINATNYVKDGINNHVVDGMDTVDPDLEGTKAAIWYTEEIEAGGMHRFRLRFSNKKVKKPWKDFDTLMELRRKEKDEFYRSIIPSNLSANQQKLVHDAFGGLLWTKQYYY